MERINFSQDEAPLISLLHDAIISHTKSDLNEGYFQKWGKVDRWMCFSDYSINNKKFNDVVTFSFLPYSNDFMELAHVIKALAKFEIKKTQNVDVNFLQFLRNGPFLNFSVILSNHKYLYFDNKKLFQKSMLNSVDQMIDFIPQWIRQNPNMEEHYQLNFKRNLIQVRRLIEQDKKLSILKNLFVITSIGSTLSTLVCNRTKAEVFGWFSDRDDINDICDNFSHHLFHMQFVQHIWNPNCQFIASPSMSSSNEWYHELIKIPDYVAGALSGFNRHTYDVSHQKHLDVLKGNFMNNTYNSFVYDFNFRDQGRPSCSRIWINGI